MSSPTGRTLFKANEFSGVPTPESAISVLNLVDLGGVLILVGVVIATIAIILSATGSTRDQARGGAVVIGFIPIVFGTDNESTKIVLILSIVLVAILKVLFFAFGHW